MSEEPQVADPTEEPRHCPTCGSRVAAMATTCLMCGSSLAEEEAPLQEKDVQRELPGWARALIVVALALLILSIGSFGLYTLMTAEPEPEDTTPTATPTSTPTATQTATPTPLPTATSTPTPIPPLAYQVKEGETLIDIAIAHDVTVEQIMAWNPTMDPDLLQVGQVILIPVATPTPGPTSTPDPSIPTPTLPAYKVHIVSPGETLSTIAENYAEQYPEAGISVESIRSASGLPQDDDTIRVNQSLVIPLGTPEPSPTPTVDPNATPTPLSLYLAVPLLSPPDGTIPVGTDEPILLQWASISVLRDDEWYKLSLSQPSGGAISATIYTRATAWRVPFDLMPAPDTDVHEFHWQVQVVREKRDRQSEWIYEPAGIPGEVRTFTWLMFTPTPSSTPTITPTYTPTPTSTPTSTPTPTHTPTPTSTSTPRPIPTPTPTFTSTPAS